MERLEPVLKQKFWILLGMGILMTVIGWWMDTGTMAASIATRKADIKAAEDKIPKDDIPNNEWSSGLASANVQQDLAVKSASRVLWERQRARMTWPETVSEFAWKDGYRLAIEMAGRQNYRNDYENDLRRVWETVRPFSRIDGTGIVDFGLGKMPRLVWNAAPSSEQMWDAQEDLWLLEGLLQSIAEVNGGANSTRADAHIHVIEKLTLHGGQPAAQRALPSAGGGGATAGGSDMDMSSFSGGSFGGGAGGGGRGGATAAASADFDVKEELGDDGSGGAGQGAAMSSFGSPAAGPGGAGGSAASKARRYVDDDKALPFRTRGFYMTLIMDHRKIPNLISELSASEKSAWPIEIIRVQVVRLNDDDPEARGGGGYSVGAGGGSDSFSGGGSGASSESGFGGGSSPSSSVEGGSSSGGSATTQGQVGLLALTTATQDPNMSRVAICGIITLYNKVEPEAVVAPSATSPPTPVTPPVAGTAAPAEAAAPTSEPAAEGDAKPEAPADGEPAAPAATAEGTPPSTEAKPAESKSKSNDAPPPAEAAKPSGAL